MIGGRNEQQGMFLKGFLSYFHHNYVGTITNDSYTFMRGVQMPTAQSRRLTLADGLILVAVAAISFLAGGMEALGYLVSLLMPANGLARQRTEGCGSSA